MEKSILKKIEGFSFWKYLQKEALAYLKGNMAIGHNRYSTAGSDSILITATCLYK